MQPRPDDVASEASYLTESCLPTGLLNDSRPASRLESPRMRVMVPCQIIVKNLPDDVTAEQISTFFAPCGETVAVMLMRHGIVPLRGRRGGGSESRRRAKDQARAGGALVTFKTAEAATKATALMDGSEFELTPQSHEDRPHVLTVSPWYATSSKLRGLGPLAHTLTLSPSQDSIVERPEGDRSRGDVHDGRDKNASAGSVPLASPASSDPEAATPEQVNAKPAAVRRRKGAFFPRGRRRSGAAAGL